MEPLEIIRINGKNIGCEDFSEVVTEVKAARERLAENNIYPTRFEVETASAFLFFSRKKWMLPLLSVGWADFWMLPTCLKKFYAV